MIKKILALGLVVSIIGSLTFSNGTKAVIDGNGYLVKPGVPLISLNYAKYQYQLKTIDTPSAERLIKQKRLINVAVIDTGIDYKHPALIGKVDMTKAFNSYSYGFWSFSNKLDTNFKGRKNYTDVSEVKGHGTTVAGLIAGNGYKGYKGVAGNLNVRIIPIKASDNQERMNAKDVARGIVYAVNNGADVINISWHEYNYSNILEEAIKYATKKNVPIIVASGNQGENLSKHFLAQLPDVIAVGSTDINNRYVDFSNYGQALWLTAPGTDVISLKPNDKFVYEAGTSFSAPMVTGVVAMMKSQDPSLSVQKIKTILAKTATDRWIPGRDDKYGYGTVNALKAIQEVNKCLLN